MAVGLVAIALLTQLPLAGASFTASTGNGGNSFAAASSWCTNPGSVSTTVSNDTMVTEKQPDTNYEGATTLMVRSKTGDLRRMFVRPVLPTIPSGCTITRVTIAFTVAHYDLRTYVIHRVGAPWSVGSITWNNQPAPTGTPATATTTDGTFTLDVTSQVIGLYEFGNNGLTMRDQTENTGGDFWNSYNTINNNRAPVVTFTYA